MDSLYIAIIVIIVLGIIGAVIGNRKKRWYKVYCANNDVMLLYKSASDWWFRDNSHKMIFRNEDGNIVVFPSMGHWILKYEAVTDYLTAKKEVDQIRQAKAG